MASSVFPSTVTGVTVQTATAGALSGDGSSGNKLAVGVDGVTIDVNGSDQLEAIDVTPPGNNFDVIFNNADATGGLGANDAFTWDNDDLELTIGTDNDASLVLNGEGTITGGLDVSRNNADGIEIASLTSTFATDDSNTDANVVLGNVLDVEYSPVMADGGKDLLTAVIGRFQILDAMNTADISSSMNGFTGYVDAIGSGHYHQANAFYGYSAFHRGTGLLDLATAFYAQTPQAYSSGDVTAATAFYAQTQKPVSFSTGQIENSYILWGDNPTGNGGGVYRIRWDGVPGQYNPSYVHYDPGSQSFERGVQQWIDDAWWIKTERGAQYTLGAGALTSSSTTATVHKVAHGYLDGATITVAGASQSEYNGDYTITVVDADHFTYTFAGSVTSPATGTITTTGGTLRPLSLGGSSVTLDAATTINGSVTATDFVKPAVVAFSGLPVSPAEGMLINISDANSATWGASITGTGANHVLARYNGTAWTVVGK